MAEGYKARTRVGMERAAEEAITEIQRRTGTGVDADGVAFEGYTPEYAAFKSGFTKGGQRRTRKSKSGKRSKVRTNFGAAAKVNLTASGNMLRLIRSKVEEVGGRLIATLFFGTAKEAAKAKGNMRKRRFFALSREQVKQIATTIRNALHGR